MNTALDLPTKRRPGDRIRERLADHMLEVLTCLLVISFSTGVLYGISVSARQDVSNLLMAAWVALMLVAAGMLTFVYLRTGRYRAGLKGEELVGQLLDELKRDGAEIVHGLFPTDRKIGDIDHVLVHPAGVFVVETKMKMGSGQSGSPVVTVVDGVVQSKFGDPCRQARRSALWLSRKLASEASYREFVTPLVVFPGCEIRVKGPMRTPVLSGHQLLKHLRKLPQRLSAREVRQLSEAINAIDSGTCRPPVHSS